MPLYECEAFEHCTKPAIGEAPHPFHGMAPICEQHAAANPGLTVIKYRTQEN